MKEFLFVCKLFKLGIFVLRVGPPSYLVFCTLASRPPLERPPVLVDPHRGGLSGLPWRQLAAPQHDTEKNNREAQRVQYPLFLGLFPGQWGPPSGARGTLQGWSNAVGHQLAASATLNLASSPHQESVPTRTLIERGLAPCNTGSPSLSHFLPFLYTPSSSVH